MAHSPADRLSLLWCQAREAEVVGILVGTLSAAHRGSMLASLKALCRRSGRKHYVFVMGKLNAAKLANFMEVILIQWSIDST